MQVMGGMHLYFLNANEELKLHACTIDMAKRSGSATVTFQKDA